MNDFTGRIFLALLTGFVLAILASAVLPELSSAHATADRVEQTGVLRVGLEGTYPPFSYVDDNGELRGFDVDISNEIALRLGVKADFVESLWVSLVEKLQNDEFDVIIAQMSITEERQESVEFTKPYVIGGTVLVARAGDDRFSQLSDIAGHTVGVGRGTTFETVAGSVEGADVRTYDDFQAYFQDLMVGKVDVIVEDHLTAAYHIQEHGLPLHITSPVLTVENIAIAVKKGNPDFVDELNRVLSDMRADGTYNSIFTNWFGSDPHL